MWFIYAARTLPPVELGLLSSGLALVVVIGGLCDLGTTRTIVRHVAARPASLKANLGRALRWRVAAGAAVGLVLTGLLPLVTDLHPATVGLAAWIAAASGATEVDFAGLRSIGRTRAEVGILVLERGSFTAVAVAALSLGAGPLAILVLYGATNTLSAALGMAAGWRAGHGDAPAGPFFDSEGRRTALSSSLLIVAPRASIVVLVLLGTPAAVAAFAVAQKPTEALSLLILALAAPTLPLIRAKVVAGARADAAAVTGRVAAAGLAASAGVLGWLVADPSGALSLLLGPDSDVGGSAALRLLALAAVVAVARGAFELLLLGHEQAGDLVRATGAALVVAVVVSAALVGTLGAAAAAWGALAGELTACALVLLAALSVASRAELVRPLVTSAGLTAATAGVVLVVNPIPVWGLAIAALSSVAGLVLARHHVMALEQAGA